MCLLLIAHQVHPDYPLILLANRDEFYSRRTAPLAYWSEEPTLLGGRDLEAGGTWLGIDRRGHLATVTNFREPRQDQNARRSRGLLVRDFLTGRQDPMEFMTRLAASATAYRGFNLLAGDFGNLARTSLHYFSNRSRDPVKVDSGVHGLSNHLLDTPWPKVRQGKAALKALMQTRADPSPEALFDMMRDVTRPPDADLPDTGVGLDLERLLSTAFISSATYGTRSTSLILVRVTGEVSFGERTYPGALAGATAGEGDSQVTTRWEHFVLEGQP
jgi:uncharacterized protein with NRDE domain